MKLNKLNEKELKLFDEILLNHQTIHSEIEKIVFIIKQLTKKLNELEKEINEIRKKELELYKKLSEKYKVTQEEIKQIVLKNLNKK